MVTSEFVLSEKERLQFSDHNSGLYVLLTEPI